MSNNSSNLNIRVSPELKEEADAVLSGLGLTMSAAVNMFLRKTVQEQGIPFSVNLKPNADTIAAMKEAERISHDPNVKGYTDIEEMMKDIIQ